MSLLTPSDADDIFWLNEQVEAARDGIESLIEIARNWTSGRKVGRLHPGVTPIEYVRDHIGTVGPNAIAPLLKESNWSNRQIAKIAGVHHTTVGVIAHGTGGNPPVARPSMTLGADDKFRPTRLAVIDDKPRHPRGEEYKALMAALRRIIELKPTLRSVYAGVNEAQIQNLQRIAREVDRIVEDILIPMDVLVIEGVKRE